jgi:hypothetical protein
MLSVEAASAIAVLGNIKSEGQGPEMGYFTEKFDWCFRIAVFEFSVCRAHAAE